MISKKKSYNSIKFLNKNFVIKNKCVLCNSRDLKKALDFGETPLANSYPSHINKKELKFLSKTIPDHQLEQNFLYQIHVKNNLSDFQLHLEHMAEKDEAIFN